MIKKLIGRLLGKAGAKAPAVPLGKRMEIGAEQHRIDDKLLAAPSSSAGVFASCT